MYEKYVNIFIGLAPNINVWVTNFDKFDKNKLIIECTCTNVYAYWRASASARARGHARGRWLYAKLVH